MHDSEALSSQAYAHVANNASMLDPVSSGLSNLVRSYGKSIAYGQSYSSFLTRIYGRGVVALWSSPPWYVKSHFNK